MMQLTTGAEPIALRVKVAMVAGGNVTTPFKQSSILRGMWLVEGMQVLDQAHAPVGMQAD
jgi:hypothetical protein